MLIVKSILAVIVNLIIYFAIGNLFVCRQDGRKSIVLSMGAGFFAYYSLFAVCTLPLMFTYRTLSTLTLIWCVVVLVLVLASIVFKGKIMMEELGNAFAKVGTNYKYVFAIALIIIIQMVIIVRSYDFTLDAAYYVANVTTSLDTNMINVYDPFTGAWQDHFELRYAFTTYSINDAVLCRIFNIPALVGTKTVMAATVAVMSNIIYLGISDVLFKEDCKKTTVMMGIICWINFTFVTLYTASNFLVSRTYEGKAVLGNITVPLIFLMFIVLVVGDAPKLYWWMLFLVSMGSSSITSSANMLVPAELSILFVPFIIRKGKWNFVIKYFLMLIPGALMMAIYVLYVKGYFVIHTYYRR